MDVRHSAIRGSKGKKAVILSAFKAVKKCGDTDHIKILKSGELSDIIKTIQ